MHVTDTATENRQLGALASRILPVALLIGVGGLVLSLILWGLGGSASGFNRAYLTAFLFTISSVLGALFFTFIQHLARAGWSVSVRRVAEAIAWNLTWIWVLFIPVAIALFTDPTLYRWMFPETLNSEQMHLLEHKQAFLNWRFFLLSSALFFGLWAFFARMFFRSSVEQDRTGDVELTRRMQGWAAPFAIIFALTISLAAFQWIMSLEFEWFSTMFGVYFFAGSCTGGFSLLILAIHFLQRTGRLTSSVTPEHLQDLGKMLFAFGIVFWAYIGFSQYMLIWYANIPEETIWFMARQMGDWGAFSLFLLVGHFIGPFLILISKHPKRRAPILAAAAGWMLFMHFADIVWLVMPRTLPPDVMHDAASYAEAEQAAVELGLASVDVNLMHATCVIGMLGLLVAATTWRLREVSLIPERDPRLQESLAFENI